MAEQAHGDHGHHELTYWRKYVFSVDHKVIGIQYAVSALFFLFFGFCLMMMMRWQLAYPGQEMPWIGKLFSAANMPEGIMVPEFYNQLGAMHGTIMVFLGVVPLAVGGFGNYVLPLQIGAPDMAFPKLNMASYWVFFVGGIIMLASFFVPEGAAQSGWTSYPPLANIAPTGQTWWLWGMVALITSSLLGSVNFIVTTVQMRAEGLSFFRLPFFVWAQFVTAFLLLLAFPPLEAAGVMQLMDRIGGTSFFMPSGLVVTGQPLEVSGGGSPLLWQHLFWFLAHPEVYVLILPAMGIVGEIVANNTRRPLWGYRTLVYSIIFLGFMSFIVWAHHMFMTGMGTTISTFFQGHNHDHLHSVGDHPDGVRIELARRVHPVLGTYAFLPGIHSHVRHWRVDRPAAGSHGRGPASARHVLRNRPFPLRGGAGHHIRAVCRGLSLVSQGDRPHDERGVGQAAFLVQPDLYEWRVHADVVRWNGRGLQAALRPDPVYAYGAQVQGLTAMSSWSAWLLGLAQIFFIINFFMSIRKGRKVESDNPWQATTLEWATAHACLRTGTLRLRPRSTVGRTNIACPGPRVILRRNTRPKTGRSLSLNPRPSPTTINTAACGRSDGHDNAKEINGVR